MRVEEGLDFAGSLVDKVFSGRMSREQVEEALATELRLDCSACVSIYDRTLAALFGPIPQAAAGAWLATTPRAQMIEFLSGVSAQAGLPVIPRLESKKRSRTFSKGDLIERAERAFTSLVSEKWARRKERVALEWHRFRGSEIARMFLREARSELPGSPDDSARWAELALIALGSNRGEFYPDDEDKSILRLRARLFQANALRCGGFLTEANDELVLTLSIADELDIRGHAFWAEAKSFLASLRKDQRDFSSAVRESRAASALFRAAGETGNEARARWQIATIYEQLGDHRAALVAIQQALPAAEASSDPVLAFGIRHLETVVLARVAQFGEALAKFEALEPLYQRFPDRENFRIWAWSLISAGLGRASEAEVAFRASRDGFLVARNAYDAALVTLDWTLFLLEQNRPEEVLPLAVSMGQAFEGLGVARETLASWNVFAEAAARRELTRTAAEGLVRSLGSERAAPQKLR